MSSPSFPCSQATHSSPFTTPPFHNKLTLPEIYDFHRKTNSTHALLCYESNNVIEELTWASVGYAMENIARKVTAVAGPRDSQEKPRVVAILAVIDQPSYLALIAGVICAGNCAFPISPRNSDAAVADLLRKSGAEFMFVSEDKVIQKLAHSARQLLQNNGSGSHRVDLAFLSVPTFSEIYQDSMSDSWPLLHDVNNIKSDDTALILHSSGSTSFPKPIYLTHRNLVQWGLQPYYGEVDISGRVLSTHALPLFHAMGVLSQCWAMMTGVVLSNFAPKSPPTVPTPEAMFSSVFATNSKLIFCVPTFLEEWAQHKDKIASLKTLDAIMFGGAPIHRQTGDILHEHGVKIYPFYGATELGGSSQFLLANPPDAGWEYFKLSPHTAAHLVAEDGEKDIFRLFYKTSSIHSPAVLNIELDCGTPAYDTNDLLVCHPTERDLWKIHGRADDQIMHSTGEKTNPVPIENIIKQHSKIAGAVVFGRGRFQAGVIIDPQLPVPSKDSITQFLDEIWPQIEEANKMSPSHSRIFKEMVIIAKGDKPFQHTAKGSPRRHLIIKSYEEEIDNLYLNATLQVKQSVASCSSVDLTTMDGCISFIRQTFRTALRLEESDPLTDEDDILQHGCDSLQAIWIRNEILASAIRYSEGASKSISGNVVYTYPTVTSLSLHIHRLCTQGNAADGQTDESELEQLKTLQKMWDLADKYSQDFAVHIPGEPPAKEVVLLTGSTGGLGSYLLESLVLNPDISHVYVLNRPHATIPSAHRQLQSFHERGIDPNFVDFAKIKFLEGDLTHHLGLSVDTYEDLRREVTCIMHIAWRVDFNVGISSMEPLIAGTRNLVDFALSSVCDKPPRFLFASSIGVLRNFPETIAPEAPVEDPRTALGSGYPESKWVAEQVLSRAREATALSPVIVRIGQLSGGRNGYWNPSEWVPSIVRSGEILGCLPRSPGLVSWLPVHTAASALTEVRACDEPFLHFLHPAAIPWNDMAELLSEALLVPQVPYKQWLSQLEQCQLSSRSEIESNPALKLLEFYQSVDAINTPEDAEAFGFPRLSTTRTVKNARCLHPPTLQPLDRKDVAGWISYWRTAGLLQLPGFDKAQYTSTLLTSNRGLTPYLAALFSGSRPSSWFPSSSIPMSAMTSQHFDSPPEGLRAQLVYRLISWFRFVVSLAVRFLTAVNRN